MNAEAVNSIIDNLAAKLSVPAEKIMEAIPSFGIMELVSVLCGIVLCAIGLYCWCSASAWKKRENVLRQMLLGYTDRYTLGRINDDVPENYRMLYIIGIILLTVGGIIILAFIESLVLWLYSPQAWSVHYLIKLFK